MLLRTGTRTRLHTSHRTSLRWPATRFTPRLASLGLAVLGLAAIAFALSGGVADWDVPSHAEKRGAKETQLRAHAEFRRWDPVSKIEVVDLTEIQPSTGEVVPGTGRKLISYDGGAQSSHIYAFDGDLAELRAHLDEHILDHFWQRGVAAAHWFARDQGARVFVAGCAGGQEVTAALLFGASEVVAVDLVGTVVELGTETYVDYNGGIFLDPRVQFYQAEARTELARREEPFDIIEIFSYHNSSRVAAGSLALKAFYLHTAETYGLCLERLSENGVLQIHQGFFPRVVTTLAEAWRRLGWDHLEQHVLIYGRDGIEDHYTILVKRSPWTAAEVEEVDRFLLADFPSEGREYSRIEDPTDRTQSFLPDAFYQAPLPDSIRARAAFRVDPVTDDNPFSLYLRKGFGSTAADPKRFATRSEAALLDELVPTRIPLPRDIAHLVLLGVAGLLLSLLAFGTTIFLARRPSGAPVCSPGNPARPTSSVTSSTPSTSVAAAHAARSHEVQPRPALASSVYFYLVGLGFIGIEWTLVQFAMRLIALPIQAFGAALGVVLVGAALGSWSSERLRARWVFPAIVLLGGGLLLVFPAIVPQLRTAPLALRVLAFAVAALPLTFCLGFPFPSALAALRNPREIASAWALNGAASVTGSVFVAALFASIGVGATGALGLLVYVGAGLLHGRVLDRRDPTSGPGPRAA